MLLLIKDNDESKALLTTHGFTISDLSTYPLDEPIMEYLTVADAIPSGYKPVTVNIVPMTIIHDEVVFYGFSGPAGLTVYTTLLIGDEDFVAGEDTDGYMSFCRTTAYKAISTLDQPHIGLSLPKDTVCLPIIIAGEIIYPVNLNGDDLTSIDDMVKQLGTVMGRVTGYQITSDEVPVDGLSRSIVSAVGGK